jgi:hypothetical protein
LSPPACPESGDGPWSDEVSRSVIQAHYLFNHRPVPDGASRQGTIRYKPDNAPSWPLPYLPPDIKPPPGTITGDSA